MTWGFLFDTDEWVLLLRNCIWETFFARKRLIQHKPTPNLIYLYILHAVFMCFSIIGVIVFVLNVCHKMLFFIAKTWIVSRSINWFKWSYQVTNCLIWWLVDNMEHARCSLVDNIPREMISSRYLLCIGWQYTTWNNFKQMPDAYWLTIHHVRWFQADACCSLVDNISREMISSRCLLFIGWQYIPCIACFKQMPADHWLTIYFMIHTHNLVIHHSQLPPRGEAIQDLGMLYVFIVSSKKWNALLICWREMGAVNLVNGR